MKRDAATGTLWDLPGDGDLSKTRERQAPELCINDGVAVRETPCKSVLNKSALSDYSLNCYTGCTHGCVYCYARFMQRFHPHSEAWGKFVDVKINAVEVLRRQLRRAKPGEVFMSSACDGWQPMESRYRLTRECCALLLQHGFHLHVLTKSDLVKRDFDLFDGRHAQVGVSITTLDENLRRLWEPAASSVAARFQVIEQARRRGLRTNIMFAPLLPFLSDSSDSLNALFERAASIGLDSLAIDALNPRPKVWPSVAELLRKQFPDLHERYRRVLFDHQVRESYLSDLRTRVAAAAERFSLQGRLSICF